MSSKSETTNYLPKLPLAPLRPITLVRMSDAKTRLAISALAIVTFIHALGANAVRNIVGWPGFITITVVLTALNIWAFIAVKPPQFRWYRIPKSLWLFLALCVASIAWSAYPFESLLGASAQIVTTAVALCMAFVLTWPELIRSLGTAIRYILGLSLLFEIFVSVFIGDRVLPLWIERPEGKVSPLLWWSRDLIFEGGPIQGLLGSSVMLGFVALLGLIVFGIQLAGRSIRLTPGIFWLLVSLLVLALTRPATVIIALVVVIIALGFALWARTVRAESRVPLYLTAGLMVALVVPIAFLIRGPALSILGKSSDLTGRIDIWDAVVRVAEQRPAFGWGWVSYWPTWVEPYTNLYTRNGLPVPHAHNAWLDVWLQLGVVGLITFALLVSLTLWRSWFRAIDRPQRYPGEVLPYAASTLLPLLVVTALIVQSLSESRILSESGWLLLTILAIKTKTDYEVPSTSGDEPIPAWRDVPLR
ncbi:O-antigen ligase family protein [Lysinibacter sp. HNR]|uniref:O-antigen ligase family protein n=1 Tax=Lysinibacter sp. HNR TaxID=3031408 RepID=UPI00243574F4|nr:O-antigen ligase family protein [Lysinibacter sp. HNR]WGD38100.1 O-antigen ligase family protein [Lysinibacter sp. HNR]